MSSAVTCQMFNRGFIIISEILSILQCIIHVLTATDHTGLINHCRLCWRPLSTTSEVKPLFIWTWHSLKNCTEETVDLSRPNDIKLSRERTIFNCASWCNLQEMNYLSRYLQIMKRRSRSRREKWTLRLSLRRWLAVKLNSLINSS